MVKAKIYEIRTEYDTKLTLQVSNWNTTGKNGKVEEGKEVALHLYHETGTDEDGEQVTFLSEEGIDQLIKVLQVLKQEITIK